MNIRQLTFAGLAAFALCQMPLAHAATETWEFDGTVTHGLASGPLVTGTHYSMKFYLSDPLPAPNGLGEYFPTVGFLFSDGSYGYGGSLIGGGVAVANNHPTSGGGTFDGIYFSLSDQSSGFSSGLAWDGTDTGVTLRNDSTGSTATPFSDTSFPSTLNLQQFAQRTMTLYFNNPPDPVTGTVDSFYINGVLQQTPEPGSLALFAVAGLVFASRAVSRRTAGNR